MKTQMNIGNKLMAILLIINIQGILALQAQKKNRNLTYMAFVELMDSHKKPSGLLYAVLDSALVLFVGEDPSKGSAQASNHDFITIPANRIYQIKLRPKGKVGRSVRKGVLYGTVAGAALGGLSAVAYEDDIFYSDVTTGEWLLAGALSGVMTGAIYGAIIGSFKTKIPINGNQQRFGHQRDFLKGHAYQMTDAVVSPPL